MFGLKRTQIIYSGNEWTLRVDGVSPKTVATSDSSHSSLVLGKHTWRVENDNKDCNKGLPYITELTLTGCKEGEFTCRDGECITMEQRCDQMVDCRDESDERDCNLLVLKASYNKKVPPITTISSTNRSLVPVQVDISIKILKIVKVEEVNHKIMLQFSI